MEFVNPETFRKLLVPCMGSNQTYKKLASGEIKNYRRGKRYMIPVSEVVQYQKRQLQAAK